LTPASSPERRFSGEKLFAPAQGQLPPPETLALYAAIDPDYPAFLRQTFVLELKRNFVYQVLAIGIAAGFAVLIAAASTFLIYTDHPKMAGVMIGANALAFAGKLLAKSRRGDSG
jgi:hypothetical protein